MIKTKLHPHKTSRWSTIAVVVELEGELELSEYKHRLAKKKIKKLEKKIKALKKKK